MILELSKTLRTKLYRSYLPPRVLLGRFRMLEEDSRLAHASLDHTYLPFYYHLGKLHPADSLVELGFGIGLCSGFYLLASPKTEAFLGFQQADENYFSLRVGRHNNKNVWRGQEKKRYFHHGSVLDESFADVLTSRKWGVALSSEKLGYDEHRFRLSLLWDNLQDGGLVVADHLSHPPLRRAWTDFCKSKNRDSEELKTRYTVGMVNK